MSLEKIEQKLNELDVQWNVFFDELKQILEGDLDIFLRQSFASLTIVLYSSGQPGKMEFSYDGTIEFNGVKFYFDNPDVWFAWSKYLKLRDEIREKYGEKVYEEEVSND